LLIITAYDMGQTSKESKLRLTVKVQDVNDNTPVFNSSVYTAKVAEKLPINTRFTLVNATDKDSGNNGRVTYHLQSGDGAVFGIFPDTGYIYNKQKLSKEHQEQYHLVVSAVDGGLPPRSATVQVIVSILDENDNTPIFSESTYVFGVEETTRSGVIVGDVSASDPDTADNFIIKYTFLSANSYFSIDDSGRITTKRELDREDMASHQFTVKAFDTGIPPRTALVNVEVRVIDINDNKPEFTTGQANAFVEENQPKGTVVLLVSARDKDNGENAAITYFFATENNADANKFQIHHRTGEITTREVLDHESRDRYTLRVVARDGGSPPQTSETIVEVSVVDVNESPPQFDQPSMTFIIRENTAPGKSLGYVQAKDPDSGNNGEVRYYIIGGNLFGTFAVNRTTGEFIVERPVDFEMFSSYSVVIRAVDNNVINPLSSTIVVNVTVLDENDNAPVFDEDPILIRIPEHMPINTQIYMFHALDADSGSAGQVKYRIKAQSPNEAWFSVEASTGILRVNKDIEHDGKGVDTISVIVMATDQPPNSQEALSTTVTALVMIQDINDNTPVFQTRSEIYMMEDEPVGYPMMSVVAVDTDSAENGRVTYVISSGNTNTHFNLNPTSGLLTIAKSLDRETIHMFTLNVTARDHGYPQRSSHMTVTVYVVDVNDNPPQFLQSVYNVSVLENKPIDSFITTLSATDPDTGKNAELEYLIPYGIADNHFQVVMETGEVTTNATLDREHRENWLITAYVRDRAFPALYDTATILVHVLDVNDNSPVFTQTLYEMNVPENAAMSVITTVKATDADTGDNGNVIYSIMSGNTDGKFSLDSTTGQLSCSPLDREVTSDYELTVTAQDGGDTPNMETALVKIHVLDDNDNEPLFTERAYAANIREDAAPDTSVVQVSAMDTDDRINGQLSYAISNNADGMFKIDKQSGLVQTAGMFDREKKATYSFEVYAVDGGLYGPRQTSVHVEVSILDVNDNAPVFDTVPYKKNISQNIGSGQFVLRVSATDPDFGTNADVEYRFVAASLYFNINRQSGEISTSKVLDPAAIRVHRLEVMATDKGTPALSTKGLVEIRVGNALGTGTLQFSSVPYNASISESSGKGTSVTRISASGASGITYSFVTGNEDDIFQINPSTGTIIVDEPKLDYESRTVHRLVVVASATNAYGYTNVYVHLVDANDNAPRFSQQRFVAAVWEGNTRLTTVTEIKASDNDSGNNGRITYSIIGGNTQGAFIIEDPQSGVIKTKIILDREIQDEYELEIEAIDGGNPPHISSCVLSIKVIDINDNSPFFPTYDPVRISEGTQPGSEVITVTANDRDLIPVLTYDFADGGNPGATFSIDRYSGRITIAKEPDCGFLK
jgi:protocadherin-16/23